MRVDKKWAEQVIKVSFSRAFSPNAIGARLRLVRAIPDHLGGASQSIEITGEEIATAIRETIEAEIEVRGAIPQFGSPEFAAMVRNALQVLE